MTIAVILKRLYQAPRNRVYQKSFHVQLFGVLTCLLAALAISALYVAPAWAQKKAVEPGRAVVNPPVLQQVPMDLERYFAEGYSIYGPAKLDSVSSKALVFPGEHDQKGLTISLLNKAVVVMDQAENAKSLRALGQGVSVIVCSRQDRVVIFIVTPQQGRSRHVR
jgi:hypothetical protein